MKPAVFEGMNCTFGEQQKEYAPLPACRSIDGVVTTCWEVESFKERLKLLLTGKVWLQQMTFNNPLQPQKVSVEKP